MVNSKTSSSTLKLAVIAAAICNADRACVYQSQSKAGGFLTCLMKEDPENPTECFKARMIPGAKSNQYGDEITPMLYKQLKTEQFNCAHAAVETHEVGTSTYGMMDEPILEMDDKKCEDHSESKQVCLKAGCLPIDWDFNGPGLWKCTIANNFQRECFNVQNPGEAECLEQNCYYNKELDFCMWESLNYEEHKGFETQEYRFPPAVNRSGPSNMGPKIPTIESMKRRLAEIEDEWVAWEEKPFTEENGALMRALHREMVGIQNDLLQAVIKRDRN